MTERVSFYSQGARLQGTLWAPSEGRLPALIVTGSWLTVKEQMPANYAPLLARAGFVVLTFDFRGFGASDGSPREVESAASKAEDIRNALAFLRTHPRVDPERVGALAICASAGYLASAMVDGASPKSVVMVAPWLHDSAIVREVYGGEDKVKERLALASRARENYAKTGQVEYVAAASNSDPSAAMYFAGEALDYYLNPERGKVPEWGDRFALMAWEEWLTFDPISIAPRVRAPVRLVTSEGSATPGGARKFEAALGGLHDSVWIEGNQFDFYDDPRTVDAAVRHAVEHFGRTL